MSAAPKLVKTADMIVGERIHLLLFQAAMTRRELALQLAVSEQTLGKKIKAISTFTLDELLTMCQIFDIDMADLLPGKDYDPVLTGQGRKGRYAIRDSNPEPADLMFEELEQSNVVALDDYRRPRSVRRFRRVAHA